MPIGSPKDITSDQRSEQIETPKNDVTSRRPKELTGGKSETTIGSYCAIKTRQMYRGTRSYIPITLSLVLAAAIIILGYGPHGPIALTHLLLILFLSVFAIVFDGKTFSSLPSLLRPATVIALTTALCSVAAVFLRESEYTVYVAGLAIVTFGMCASIATSYGIRPRQPDAMGLISREVLVRLAVIILLFSLVSAILFFYQNGVPVLSDDVEQRRVDVAGTGTGYFRLLAYMSIPATIILYAARHRYRHASLLCAVVIILALANRSPLLYLIFPIVVMSFSSSSGRTNKRVVMTALFSVAAVAGFGVYRVMNQPDFASYAEFRNPIQRHDVLAIALYLVRHYAAVVPQNYVTTKSLVDAGLVPFHWGSSYLTLFITALPGEQMSLDREIRAASGASFIGGGIPPTLAGEGYANWGYVGVFLSGFFLVMLLVYCARHLLEHFQIGARFDPLTLRMRLGIYGYAVCWLGGSPIAGFAGASTVPLAGFLVLLLCEKASRARKM